MGEPLTLQTVPNGSLMNEYQLAPGVFGYAVEVDGSIYVPVITAENPGSGQVGAFLDRLPENVRIPNVLSRRLLGMLTRRGWRLTTEIDETGDSVAVDVFVHPKAPR